MTYSMTPWADPELTVSNHIDDRDANATRTEYDSRGNVVAQIDANASTTVDLQVVRNGLLTLAVNDTGNAVVRLHDGLGRPIRTVRELRLEHDGAQPLDTSNPYNNDGLITTQQDWDANSRLVSVADDPNTSQSAGPLNPSTTRYEYDNLDRRTIRVNADGTTQSADFDRDSHLVVFTDENGSQFARTYDDLGRTTRIEVDRAAGEQWQVEGTTRQVFQYDGLSRVTLAIDVNDEYVSAVTSRHDSLSRKFQDTQATLDSDGQSRSIETVTYEFDANSNLVQVTYPNGRQVTYGYQNSPDDAPGQTLNRIEVIEEGPGTIADGSIVPTGSAAMRIAEYGYEGPSRITTRQYGNGGDGNGVRADFAYDALRRRTEVIHSDADLGGVFAHGRVGIPTERAIV